MKTLFFMYILGNELIELTHFAPVVEAKNSNITAAPIVVPATKLFSKVFNTVHIGFTRKDDYLPQRIMEESLTVGPYKGEYMIKEKFDSILDEYYEAQGWNVENSLQKREALERLGMDYLIK